MLRSALSIAVRFLCVLVYSPALPHLRHPLHTLKSGALSASWPSLEPVVRTPQGQMLPIAAIWSRATSSLIRALFSQLFSGRPLPVPLSQPAGCSLTTPSQLARDWPCSSSTMGLYVLLGRCLLPAALGFSPPVSGVCAQQREARYQELRSCLWGLPILDWALSIDPAPQSMWRPFSRVFCVPHRVEPATTRA